MIIINILSLSLLFFPLASWAQLEGSGFWADASICEREVTRNPELAIQYCTIAIQKSHTLTLAESHGLARAFKNRGDAYMSKRDYDRAIQDYDQAISRVTSYDGAYFQRALAKRYKGDFDGALADANKVVELKPNSADGFAVRGYAKAGKREYDAATADYDRAIALSPKYVWALHQRASTKLLKKDIGGVIADYTSLAAIDPSKAQNWFDLAFYKAFYDGRFEESLPDFNRAIELDPKLAAAFWERGLVFLGLGRVTEAVDDFRKTVELAKPGETTADVGWLSLWMAQARSGKQELASKDVAAYLKIRDAAKATDSHLLSLRFFAGEFNEAEFFRLAEAAKPGSKESDRVYSFFMVGMKRLGAADRSGAAKFFEKCIQLSEKSGWYYWNALYELKKLRS